MIALFIIIDVVLYLSLINHSLSYDCSKYNNCFTCNIIPQCLWKDTSCQPSSIETSYNYSTKFSTCSDSSVITNPSVICPKLTKDSFPLTLSLKNPNLRNLNTNISKYNNENTFKHLFCFWNISSINSDNSFKITLNKNNLSAKKEELIFITISNDGDFDIYKRFPYKQTFRLKHIKTVVVFLYCENIISLTENNSEINLAKKIYFELNISYSFFSNQKIIWTIVISCGLLLIIVGIAVLIYHKIIKKRCKTQPRNRQLPNFHLNSQLETEHRKLGSNKHLIQTMFKKQKYSQIQNPKNQTKCTICFETFDDESDVIILKCLHIFHFICIETWSIKTIHEPTCPNCNMFILANIVHEDNNIIQSPSLDPTTSLKKESNNNSQIE